MHCSKWEAKGNLGLELEMLFTQAECVPRNLELINPGMKLLPTGWVNLDLQAFENRNLDQVATSNGSPQSNCTHESGALVEKGLLLPLLAMTVVTGFVDAVSYLGLGQVFTANMTGNVVLLGLALTGAPRLSIARPLTALLAFLLGGVVGGRLDLSLSGGTRRRHVLVAAAFEAMLLCAAALACTRADITADRAVVRADIAIVLTAAAMGLRTATVRRLAVADITTTVVTSVLAAFAADSSLAGGKNLRIGRRVGSVFSMLAGAAIGALLLRFGLAVPLICGGVLVLAAACIYACSPFAALHLDKDNA